MEISLATKINQTPTAKRQKASVAGYKIINLKINIYIKLKRASESAAPAAATM